MATRTKRPRTRVIRAKRSRPPTAYRPSDDEEFMNPRQLEYFKQKLLRWRAELLADSTDTLRHLKEDSLLKPDLTDRASLETERSIELRTRDRERKLISKIDAALARIDTGTYDLSVKNPNGGDEVALRTPQDILDEMEALLAKLDE